VSTSLFVGGDWTMLNARFGAAVLALLLTLTTALTPGPALAASAAEIDRDVTRALQDLYAKNPKARELGAKAKGILVFPSVVKAGFLFGGQYGEGALRRGGRTVGYYNTVAASYGLQAGIQTFGYALMFMTDAALKYLDKSDGFELGTAPSIVILDQGAAGGISTSSAQSDMYAMFFDQRGLMGGIGLQGTKISRIDK
jgi:lipid-binding SYLF domain-containing protein